MGAYTSNLRGEDVQEIQKETGLPAKDIRKLYNRFKNLDKDNSGTITMEEILALPELAMNPMVSRVAALFQLSSDEHINFTQFAKTLAIFTPSGKLEDKLKAAFKVYDINNDGFITHDDLVENLKLMVGDNFTEEQISSIATQTLETYDLDKDGKISPKEFNEMMVKEGVEAKMSIELRKKWT
jgi:serine/threonine-protein phosphatase 2B regulatory subunit